MNKLEAFNAAADADIIFQAELERVYGKDAGDARYFMHHKDAKVEQAAAAYRAAVHAWQLASDEEKAESDPRIVGEEETRLAMLAARKSGDVFKAAALQHQLNRIFD